MSRRENQHELKNSDQLSPIALSDEKGFRIHEDDNQDHVSIKAAEKFEIFDENYDQKMMKSKHSNPSSTTKGLGFQIFEDFNEGVEDKKTPASMLTVYEEEDEDHTTSRESLLSDTYAQGDTATFSLLGDTMGNGDFKGSSPSSSSPGAFSEQGDTATLSVFKEVFSDISPVKKDVEKLNESRHVDTGGGFSIFVDDDIESVNVS